MGTGEKPRTYVRRLALEKAREVARENPSSWVLAADTAVVVDETILGKPRDDKEAKQMLRRLSDRWHQVVSGMALVSIAQNIELAAISVTRVRFRKMREAEIRWYVATGEPSDKAGAYAIQGKGDGAFSVILTFPLIAVQTALPEKLVNPFWVVTGPKCQ